VPFGVLTRVLTSVGPLRLVVPFIFHYARLFFFFFMQRNNIDVLIFPINTFLEQCIWTPQHQFLKCLCYSRGIWTSTDMMIRVQDTSKKLGVTAGYIHGLVAIILSLSLQPHFDRLKMKLNISHVPLMGRFLENKTKYLPHPLFGKVSSALFLWVENETKRLPRLLKNFVRF